MQSIWHELLSDKNRPMFLSSAMMITELGHKIHNNKSLILSLLKKSPHTYFIEQNSIGLFSVQSITKNDFSDMSKMNFLVTYSLKVLRHMHVLNIAQEKELLEVL